MDNLKTLKDLDELVWVNGDAWGAIKQMAIDWCNHYILLEEIEVEAGMDCTKELQLLMHLFNLQEDDLNL